MEQVKIHIKKGDTVKILSGNNKNKTGKVLRVFPKTYRAIVEGMNIVTKHTKPSAGSPQGGIVKTEAPIHISNLMVVAGSQPTRVGRKLNDNGKLQRYSRKTGDFIK